MRLYVNNNTFHYELENLCRVFFPNEKIEVSKDAVPHIEETDFVLIQLDNLIDEIKITVKVSFTDFAKLSEKQFSNNTSLDDLEREAAVMLFDLLTEYTQIILPWGILTGVRPIKLARRMINTHGKEYTESYFKDKLKVSQEKIKLAMITEANERKILELSRKESYSLYVSIPFCPTRCCYCSFVSQSIEKAKRLIEPYVEKLCEELKETAKIMLGLNLRLETVYIGGGTPTTLSALQMKTLIDTVYANFDMSYCREFTVEAGRPDTITDEKLEAMKNGGVNRISINPQTLNDNVLVNIGRQHTAQQTLDAFVLARKHGFNHINTDLIAGLPGDSLESFKNTLDKIISLSPESVTVHTLAMKKSSALTLSGMELYREDAHRTADMLRYCEEQLTENGYHPYYLYRQSRMVGNLENVGWAKDGCDGLYNVYIMDETHTIAACGAGAVTKLKSCKDEYLERIFNFKYPYEYISRFDELMQRKGRVDEFYDEFF